MACGKSRVGAMLAQKLGLALYDLDSLIEQEQQQSIKEIFARKGELYFRSLELQMLKKLANLKNSIIVCGGGTPTFFESLTILQALGELFFLDASFALISKRLKKSTKRPLGMHNSQEENLRLKNLYTFRRPLYMNFSHTIDVNHEDKEQTCLEIIDRYDSLKKISHLKTIKVQSTQRNYPIFIREKSIEKINEIIMALGFRNYKKIIVSSDNLAITLKSSIDQINKNDDAAIITIRDGEENKNFTSIHHIHEQMFKQKCNRSTIILAVGGGNVGDVAGFAAATFMRGIPIIQIPSTLLAMVDSSVGGKTGIDTKFGKNLVGAFHNPHAVIIDSTILKTLPSEEYSCGMAEIIKHAIIGDAQLFEDLAAAPIESSLLIERAVRVKTEIVFADPTEQNIRACLNLGHTFAHALEKITDYRLKHGQAVAIGLVLATQLSYNLGFLKSDFRPELLTLLEKYHLPSALPKNIDKGELILAMSHDKKRDHQGLKFILPHALGDVRQHYVDEQRVAQLLS